MSKTLCTPTRFPRPQDETRTAEARPLRYHHHHHHYPRRRCQHCRASVAESIQSACSTSQCPTTGPQCRMPPGRYGCCRVPAQTPARCPHAPRAAPHKTPLPVRPSFLKQRTASGHLVQPCPAKPPPRHPGDPVPSPEMTRPTDSETRTRSFRTPCTDNRRAKHYPRRPPTRRPGGPPAGRGHPASHPRTSLGRHPDGRPPRYL
mmetsp:Transcript_14558/g.41461  ORF Transcript_14558/g.41461 Transcript_14558/m.41461 type:complete len:204 (+) Transcript_14558:2657-3268(+)